VYQWYKNKFLCQEYNVSIHKDIWTGTSKDGHPKFLTKGIGVIKFRRLCKHPDKQRAILTALYYYMIYSGPIDDSNSTITTGFIGEAISFESVSEKIIQFSKRWLEHRNVPVFQPSDSSPIFGTTKACVNGQHAMGVSSIKDIRSIHDSSLLTKIKEFLPLFYVQEKVDELIRLINESLEQGKDIKKSDYKDFSARIHRLAEPGGKTRVITIPDIWTQCVLQSFHSFLMGTLKRHIPHDGTFDHDKAAELCRKQTENGPLYCYDLTAVTDRLPLSLQKKVLSLLSNEDTSCAWSTLLVDRDIDDNGNRIRYAVGQPMGILSSWPAMAITHHMIINYCKWKVGKLNTFHQVIGDDVAIASRSAAKEYEKIISILGVEISKEKSVLSNRNGNFGELAKRIFSNGKEISPIPPLILTDASSNLLGFCQFMRVFTARTLKSESFCELDRSRILSFLFQRKIINDQIAHIVLSSPIRSKKLGLPEFPSITGLRSSWRGGQELEMAIANDYDRFLNESAARDIVEYSMKNKFLGPSGNLVFSEKFHNAHGLQESDLSPLLNGYRIEIINAIHKCLRPSYSLMVLKKMTITR
jgi:hypothetical protein